MTMTLTAFAAVLLAVSGAALLPVPAGAFAAWRGATEETAPRVVLAERRAAVMGTTPDVGVAGPARHGAVAEIERVEALLSTWRDDTPLARLNGASAGTPSPVGAELAVLLDVVLAWSPRTNGAFDPAIAPLVRAWDLRGAGRVPGVEEIR